MSLHNNTLEKYQWTINDERKHLDSLPYHVTYTHKPQPTRAESLKGYLEGARLRETWEKLNREACIFYAERLLAQAQEEE